MTSNEQAPLQISHSMRAAGGKGGELQGRKQSWTVLQVPLDAVST